MKTQDAISFFGSASAVAVAANISKAAVSQWGDLVPLKTAVLLEHVSQGKLQAHAMDYFNRNATEIERAA
jgi:hypothetical protein